MMLRRIFRFFLSKWLGIVFLLFGVVIFSNVIIINSVKGEIYDDIDEIPSGNPVILLLGTSRYTNRGTTNLYFKNRIQAAAQLYHSGRIKHIIVSGDNSMKEYNEPREMQRELMKKGVPKSSITLDYAGFRTLDSVVRCKKIFGQNKIVIVSQRFHLERALFIAKKYDISAFGFVAKDPKGGFTLKTRLREYLAKTKAVIDLYIISKEPKFLGKKEEINL